MVSVHCRATQEIFGRLPGGTKHSIQGLSHYDTRARRRFIWDRNALIEEGAERRSTDLLAAVDQWTRPWTRVSEFNESEDGDVYSLRVNVHHQNR